MRVERYVMPVVFSTPVVVSMDAQAIPFMVRVELGSLAIYCENSSLIFDPRDRQFRLEHTLGEVPVDYHPKRIGSTPAMPTAPADGMIHAFEIS